MSQKYEFIDAEYADPPAGGQAPTITCMCKWLGVSTVRSQDHNTAMESWDLARGSHDHRWIRPRVIAPGLATGAAGTPHRCRR
ncbi:MAG TPA: hypothetical protein VGZ22_25305, partial [Isosphaeraceae bacterium]|nr:hypothetical protein [Isosphaeraceae bacterium]